MPWRSSYSPLQSPKLGVTKSQVMPGPHISRLPWAAQLRIILRNKNWKVYVDLVLPNKKRLSTEDASSIVGCSSGFYAGKRSEGKVSLPLCSLTIWYYRYALTLLIAKPDPTHAWHSELNTSLGTTTRNQPNRFGPLEL